MALDYRKLSRESKEQQKQLERQKKQQEAALLENYRQKEPALVSQLAGSILAQIDRDVKAYLANGSHFAVKPRKLSFGRRADYSSKAAARARIHAGKCLDDMLFGSFYNSETDAVYFNEYSQVSSSRRIGFYEFPDDACFDSFMKLLNKTLKNSGVSVRREYAGVWERYGEGYIPDRLRTYHFVVTATVKL